jgi:hypothetical protein
MTDFAQQIPDTPIIGILFNNWRQRRVTVHAHPADDSLVVSVGRPFDGSAPVICEEPKANWTRVLSLHPEVAVYD